MADDLRDASFGDLLRRLSEDTSALVHDEIELAKAELAQKGKQAGAGAGLLSGAAVIGLGAFGAFTAFAILILDTVLAAWLAALIVFVVFVAVAGALAMLGKGRLQRAMPPVPEQTVQTVKEDVAWAQNQTSSGKT